MSKRVSVSVVIPTFNAPDTCVATLRSLDVGGYEFEIVVVNDGSTPQNQRRLQNELRAWQGELASAALSVQPRLVMIQQENAGAYRARLAGVKASTAKYIKFLDHDDRLIPGALAREVAFADEVEADVVMADWYQGFYDGVRPDLVRTAKHRAPEYADPLTDFLELGGVYTGAALYRRELFDTVAPIRSWEPRLKDDWAIFGQVCLEHPEKGFFTLHEASYVWIHHGEQQTASAGSAENIGEVYRFLSWFDEELEERYQYSLRRRCAMAAYYMKNALLLCQHHPTEWRRIAGRIKELCPAAGKTLNANLIAKLAIAFFGAEHGVRSYVAAKRVFGRA